MKFEDRSEAQKANTRNLDTITCTIIDIVAEVPSLQEIIIHYEGETPAHYDLLLITLYGQVLLIIIMKL